MDHEALYHVDRFYQNQDLEVGVKQGPERALISYHRAKVISALELAGFGKEIYLFPHFPLNRQSCDFFKVSITFCISIEVNWPT